MAANDVTISMAAASQNLKVRKLTRRSPDTLPQPAGTQISVLAGGNTVINLGPNDSIIIERSDVKAPVGDALRCGFKEDLEK